MHCKNCGNDLLGNAAKCERRGSPTGDGSPTFGLYIAWVLTLFGGWGIICGAYVIARYHLWKHGLGMIAFGLVSLLIIMALVL